MVARKKTQRKTRARRVKFCPKCGSTEIYWALGLAHLWSIWECRNCGYYGAFIIENGKLAQKLQEEYANKMKKQFREDREED